MQVAKLHSTAAPLEGNEAGVGDAGEREPAYWAEACAWLAARDPVLAALIAAHRAQVLVANPDPFATLARSIVGQQISTRAAEAVWQRLRQRCQPFSPGALAGLDAAALRAVGLSARKAEYLLDLARWMADGQRGRAAHWARKRDEDIERELCALRGVGRWTAQMFLIFHLRRPDVLPLDDAGLLQGTGLAYGGGGRAARSTVRERAEAWAPFRTVATWYIWRSLQPVPVPR